MLCKGDYTACIYRLHLGMVFSDPFLCEGERAEGVDIFGVGIWLARPVIEDSMRNYFLL